MPLRTARTTRSPPSGPGPGGPWGRSERRDSLRRSTARVSSATWAITVPTEIDRVMWWMNHKNIATDPSTNTKAMVIASWRHGSGARRPAVDHRAEHGERVEEGGREDAERVLRHPVIEEGPQHARAELAARQLQGHDGDREDQAGDRDHRASDRGQQRARPGAAALEQQRHPVRVRLLELRHQQPGAHGAEAPQRGDHPERAERGASPSTQATVVALRHRSGDRGALRL